MAALWNRSLHSVPSPASPLQVLGLSPADTAALAAEARQDARNAAAEAGLAHAGELAEWTVMEQGPSGDGGLTAADAAGADAGAPAEPLAAAAQG